MGAEVARPGPALFAGGEIVTPKKSWDGALPGLRGAGWVWPSGAKWAHVLISEERRLLCGRPGVGGIAASPEPRHQCPICAKRAGVFVALSRWLVFEAAPKGARREVPRG